MKKKTQHSCINIQGRECINLFHLPSSGAYLPGTLALSVSLTHLGFLLA